MGSEPDLRARTHAHSQPGMMTRKRRGEKKYYINATLVYRLLGSLSSLEREISKMRERGRRDRDFFFLCHIEIGFLSFLSFFSFVCVCVCECAGATQICSSSQTWFGFSPLSVRTRKTKLKLEFFFYFLLARSLCPFYRNFRFVVCPRMRFDCLCIA